jgi:hypothetical protein
VHFETGHKPPSQYESSATVSTTSTILRAARLARFEAKPAFKSKPEENEMEQSVEKIIERNLLAVFNRRDADSPRQAIDELWDRDSVFIDPGGVHDGVEKINAIVEVLSTQFKGYVFSARGLGQSMHGVGRHPCRMDRPMTLSGLLALTLV